MAVDNKQIIRLLKRRLKDKPGTVGIELTTDGDSGRHAAIYSEFIYDYIPENFEGDPTFSNIAEMYLEDSEEEERNRAHTIDHVSKEEVISMVEQMLGM